MWSRARAYSNVICQRLSDFGQQRRPVVPVALSTNEDFSRAPVDIVYLHDDDLWRAQTETRHQQNHRIVAPASWCRVAHGIENHIDLFEGEMPRQTRAEPLRHTWHGVCQIGGRL